MNIYSVEKFKEIGNKGTQFFEKELDMIKEYATRRKKEEKVAIVFYNKSFNLFQCLNSDVTEREIAQLELAIELDKLKEITFEMLFYILLTMLCAVDEAKNDWIEGEIAIKRTDLELLKSNINSENVEILETIDQFFLNQELHPTMLVKLRVNHISAIWELGRSHEIVRNSMSKEGNSE